MSSETGDLRIFFFPLLSQGHIIPTIDMARLFAAQGVKATIITTPLNKPIISKSLNKPKLPPHHPTITIKTINFPQGCEQMDSSLTPNNVGSFLKATMKLQEPLEQLLYEEHPHCLVADMFFPWAIDSAVKFGIPSLVFHGIGLFSMCASLCVATYEPYKDVPSDSEPFVLPNLPGDVRMNKRQFIELVRKDDEVNKIITKLLKDCREAELRGIGVIANTFYELESVYAEHYRKFYGRRLWLIGPLSLCNRSQEEKAQRGVEASVGEQDQCLNWLASKKPNSVVYVCFGSMPNFSDSQQAEIAMALEGSGQDFIWVVRKGTEDVAEEKEEWLPEGFEKRMEGKGLIIRCWAPQVLILEHEAVGAFVTHCGWNSTLEGVSAGVPMVTWPLGAEQFYNEKLLTEILRNGVSVGAKIGDFVHKSTIQDALNRVMVGEEAEQLRNRAKYLAIKAREAIDVGGSSYSDLNSLIQELQSSPFVRNK